jgi:hypothetical protein
MKAGRNIHQNEVESHMPRIRFAHIPLRRANELGPNAENDDQLVPRELPRPARHRGESTVAPTFSVRRMLALGLTCVAAALALFPSTSQASGQTFYDSNGLARAYSQVGFTCFGRYVHYRADTFRTDDRFWFNGTLYVWFRTEYDQWNGSTWVNRGPVPELANFTPATGGGQFAATLPAGSYFRLRTQYAWTFGSGYSYSNWKVEAYNGGLEYCRV